MKTQIKTANSINNQWFAGGKKLLYSPQLKKIIAQTIQSSVQPVQVWSNYIQYPQQSSGSAISFLPGFPFGSVEWIKVNKLLEQQYPVNRLFLDYIGQGDSEKPVDYPYSTFERADLVEAIWKANNLRETVVVTIDYSSLVLLEILARQIDLKAKGETPFTKITKVLMINGGYFIDGHSHPIMSTPLLVSPMGKFFANFSGKSKWTFAQMTRNMWAKEYVISEEELDTVFDAIMRRNGSHFLHHAAGFVYEHQAQGARLDFSRIFFQVKDETTFHIMGSDQDPFEPKQLQLSEERLGSQGVITRLVEGGHMIVAEKPQLILDALKVLISD